jgi:hypothetical protein
MSRISVDIDLHLSTQRTASEQLFHRDILVINTTEVGRLIGLPLLLSRLRLLRLEERRQLLLLLVRRTSLSLCLGRPLPSRRRVLLVLLRVRSPYFRRIASPGARYRVLLLPHLLFCHLTATRKRSLHLRYAWQSSGSRDLALEVELRQHVHGLRKIPSPRGVRTAVKASRSA